MKIVLFALAVILGSSTLLADELPLKEGRYPGEAMVFRLTENQRKTIEHFRSCHMARFREMNMFTPYVFRLTASQSKALRSKMGFSPKVFQVYETVSGYNEAGPHWNLVLRFSENEFEIPLNLLLTDKKAMEAHSVQGWQTPNPCFNHKGAP